MNGEVKNGSHSKKDIYRYFEMDKDLEKILIKKYIVVSRLPRRLAGEVEYIEIQLVA